MTESHDCTGKLFGCYCGAYIRCPDWFILSEMVEDFTLQYYKMVQCGFGTPTLENGSSYDVFVDQPR